MKALKAIATTVLALTFFSAQVLAVGSGSPVAGDGPKIKKAIDADGNDITAYLVVTKLGTTSPYAEVNAYLKSANDDINNADGKPANLLDASGSPLKAKIQSLLDSAGSSKKAEDLTFDEVFDVSYVVNGVVMPLPSQTTIEFDYGVENGATLIMIHQTSSGVWAVEGASATTTVTTLSPFAFLVAKGTEKAAKDDKGDGKTTSPQTGEYVTKSVLVGALVLAAAGVVCVTRAKKSSAN